MNAKLNRPAHALADLAEGSILAVIEIAAAPERVFRALASEEISSWRVQRKRTTSPVGAVMYAQEANGVRTGSDPMVRRSRLAANFWKSIRLVA